MSSRIALIGACFLLLGLVAGAGLSEVKIDSGRIAGEMLDEHSGLTVYRGIPYVAPPVGELRWREPQPVTPKRLQTIAWRHAEVGYVSRVMDHA